MAIDAKKDDQAANVYDDNHFYDDHNEFTSRSNSS